LIVSAVKDLARYAIIKGLRACVDAWGWLGNQQNNGHPLCSYGASMLSRKKEHFSCKGFLFDLESGEWSAIKNQSSLLFRKL
jgi:hypothetical protein